MAASPVASPVPSPAPSSAPSHRHTHPADGPSRGSEPYLVAAPDDPTIAHAAIGRHVAPPATPPVTVTPPVTAPESPFPSPSTGRLRFVLVPGYELLGELGRGGMGVVYRARQTRLNRLVALKMLLNHDLADPSDEVRFRSEAEAVAAVKHPHVVQVYEFGQADGRPYFAMEFLAGGSLHGRLRASAPFPPADAAALVEKLARAVHAAHAQGIVHRDLKPGNVLFDAAGEPRVTDFGLAKRGESDLTQTRAVMGTPAYMAPEQASGRTKYAGPAADIYALGVILYECLTGGTPFRDDDSLRLVRQVIAESPPPVRSRVPGVPRDLERVCLKCLEKEPADRYPTAAALADDLRRFAAGEPVSARPPGVLEHAVKWARRRPTVALAYGLGLLVLVLTLFGGAVLALWVRADAARAVADRHADDAERARRLVEGRKAEADAANGKLAVQNRELEVTQATLTARNAELDGKHAEVRAALAGEQAALIGERAARALADRARAELEKLSYFRNVGFAHHELRGGNYLRAIQLLDDCPEPARRWEWWHVYRAAHGEFGSGVCGGVGLPLDVAFAGDTNNVVTAHHTHAAVIRFDFETGRGPAVKFHPDKWLAALCLSADGNRMLTLRGWHAARADGIEVWDHAAGVRLANWKSPRAACLMQMLSGDGRRAVVAYQGEPIRAFDVDTGKELGTLPGIELPHFTFGRMSHDGAVAAVIDGKSVVVWAVATGEVIRRLPPDEGTPTYVAVAPDGNRVVVGDDGGRVRFHDVAGKKAVTGGATHGGPVSAVAVSEDGRTVATAGEDGAVRLWSAATGRLLKECHGHTKKVTALRFDRRGAFVASTDAANAFRVWDVHEYFGPRNDALAMPGTVAPFFLSDDLTRLFAPKDAKAGVLSNYSNGVAYPFGLPPGGLGAVGFRPAPAGSPGDRQVVLAGAEGHLFAFGKLPAAGVPFGELPGRVDSLTYTPDGRFFLARAGGHLSVWDADKLAEVFSVNAFGPGTAVAGISPDGKSVVAAKGQHLSVWDVATKKETRFYTWYELSAAGFTPDGKQLVVGTRDWKLELWDRTPLERGAPNVHRKFSGHTAAVVGFGFNADGSRLATGAADGTVKVWDVASRHEALGLTTGHRKPVSRVWWGPNDILAAIPDGEKPVLFNGQKRDRVVRPDRPNEK